MGILSLLQDKASKAIKNRDLNYYRGCKIAVNAPVVINQSLTSPFASDKLGKKDGKQSDHIFGLLVHASYMINNDIWPVYVFDGKTTSLKRDRIERKQNERDRINGKLKHSCNGGETDDKEILELQSDKLTDEIISECKKLLTGMGIPYLDAPGQVEAYCAALCRAGLVCGVATTDVGALAFGTAIMLPDVMHPTQEKVTEIDHDVILRSLGITREQFIDLCILLGCDYCEKIGGIEPEMCVEYIRQFRSIEGMIESEKFQIPNNWNYEEARKLFKNDTAVCIRTTQLKWKKPDKEWRFCLATHDPSIVDGASDYVSKLINSNLPSLLTGNACEKHYKQLISKKSGCNQVKGIRLIIFGRERWACVDLDAEFTAISKELWNTIEMDYEKSVLPSGSSIVRTRFFDGKMERSPSNRVVLEVDIAGVLYKIEAYVTDLDNYRGKEVIVFGKNFHREYVPVIARLTYTLKDGDSLKIVFPIVECP